MVLFLILVTLGTLFGAASFIYASKRAIVHAWTVAKRDRDNGHFLVVVAGVASTTFFIAAAMVALFHICAILATTP